MNHHDDYDFERDYWGKCCNTFDEDQKHYVYANLMGIKQIGYSFDAESKKILDIGGGPTSMLLKCLNLKWGLVIDPIAYPQWTVDRYKSMNIDVVVGRGESRGASGWDEVWIYNCLQHAEDPELVIANAKRAAPVVRFFEWIDIPAHDGHPHMLTEELLNKWLGGKGGTCNLAQSGCYGRAYYGVFK